ncbi:hypothetical protein D9M71_563330 [compost metagenome]
MPGPFFDKRRGIAWIHHQHRFATFGQGEEQIAQAENVVERHREQQHVILLGSAQKMRTQSRMLLGNVEQQSPMTDGHAFGLPCSATAIDYEGRLLGCNGRALT